VIAWPLLNRLHVDQDFMRLCYQRHVPNAQLELIARALPHHARVARPEGIAVLLLPSAASAVSAQVQLLLRPIAAYLAQLVHTDHPSEVAVSHVVPDNTLVLVRVHAATAPLVHRPSRRLLGVVSSAR
jgi:hypothetical protein